jgi:hypothetical protein
VSGPVRILAIADTDSYVKWGASVLDRLPAAWSRGLAVLTTPAAPSGDQLVSALAGTGTAPAEAMPVSLAGLGERIRSERPDAVLLALRGPVVRVAVRAILAAGGPRPALFSGMPGITVPARPKAIHYRAQTDLIVLHSEREREEFSATAAQLGIEPFFALATLGFLPRRPADARPGGTADAFAGGDLVFAAQAKVPREREQRLELLGWLADAARTAPERRVIVKVRALGDEAQTHEERWDYPSLLAELPDAPANLVVEAGPMAEHLARAGGLVTVSSTAALESIGMGVPTLVLGDFGVSHRMINAVFEGSGVIGGADDLRSGRAFHAAEDWLARNYFHAAEAEDWIATLEALVARRRAEGLPARRPTAGTLGGALRQAWDRKRALGHLDRSLAGTAAEAVGLPLRGLVRLVRRLRRRLAAAQTSIDSPTASRA